MVNLTFYRLDVTFPIILWQFRSTTFHLFPFSVPFSGTVIHVGISLLIFEVHLVRCFPNCFCTFGHLLFGFRFPGEIFVFADLREDQGIFDDHGSWFRFAGCWWYHDGFFQTTSGVRSDRSHLIYLNFLSSFWSIRQILFTSVLLHYYDVKSDWLPLFPVAFGSPPEDLLFRYLLFVPIEYHGNPNFSRWNVSQMHGCAFVRNTDFSGLRTFWRWLEKGSVIW